MLMERIVVRRTVNASERAVERKADGVATPSDSTTAAASVAAGESLPAAGISAVQEQAVGLLGSGKSVAARSGRGGADAPAGAQRRGGGGGAERDPQGGRAAGAVDAQGAWRTGGGGAGRG